MKKSLLFLTLSLFFIAYHSFSQTTIPIFDQILYYDGYAARVDTPAPPPGVIRQRNDLYSVKLTQQQIDLIGDNLTMNVTIKASCDNYDRIGNVNLAFVPKGAETYSPDSVERIEIGRYITPFMNKNLTPDTVPYTYNINNVVHLLKETSITATYDIWVELQVFGVPYAANEQIAGCAGRNDVFFGSLNFVTNTGMQEENNNILMPLNFQDNLNNYDSSATDSVGITRRTINFNVDQNLTDAIFVLITSNHGANNNGEEYNRRNHFVYFDGNQVLTYKPGRTSCEPFRVYNTQQNGIYGPSPKSDASWQSFSNWCPGDVIDTRIIQLGAVNAGSHTFVLNVPDAVFADQQGYFPVSLYLQGKTSGTLGLHNIDDNSSINIYPNPVNDLLNVEILGIPNHSVKISLVNILGQEMFSTNIDKPQTTISTSSFPSGIYSLICTSGNSKKVEKVVISH